MYARIGQLVAAIDTGTGTLRYVQYTGAGVMMWKQVH